MATCVQWGGLGVGGGGVGGGERNERLGGDEAQDVRELWRGVLLRVRLAVGPSAVATSSSGERTAAGTGRTQLGRCGMRPFKGGGRTAGGTHGDLAILGSPRLLVLGAAAPPTTHQSWRWGIEDGE
jgi:hypothetical protein